ncbi:hypothetical protein VTJ83DRAFT_1453 [Remersonia thermophila]|uniref:TPR domain protein n=1 Tax=Remersonia thermophila TaxID=72144 RepID=A0ABR4DGU8_9PEZI
MACSAKKGDPSGTCPSLAPQHVSGPSGLDLVRLTPASTSIDDGYYNLGPLHMPITTASSTAQTWFNRGLVWCYAFNHGEAVKCFERAVAEDASCTMGHWGIAYALGPNYNKPWGSFDDTELENSVREARCAVLRALDAASVATPLEQGLVHALVSRYPRERLDPEEGRSANHAYAAAMERVYEQHADDPNVVALYVDALMNLTPWALWDTRTGEPADKARTLDCKAALEKGLARFPEHPGMLHQYIHLMEMSSHPEHALKAADTLRGLVPDAGHLNHMPSHIDILCGDYRRAVRSNIEAVVADNKYIERDGAINFYTLYRCHNFHFAIYAAMFAGQYAIALDMVKRLEATLPEALLRIKSPPMADWLEGFMSIRIHVLVRFGRWQDIIDLGLPKDRDLYCTTTAMVYYGKGVALANTGRISEAEEYQCRFREAIERVPSSRTIFNNTCRDILAIASSMLDGELEYRRGNVDLGFEHLRRAIERDDSLPYDEPWGWMQPTRHAYGALLLEQGRVDEALEVYMADLGYDNTLPRCLQHRDNVWALHGAHECLTRLGRANEARIIRPQLELALAVADVPVNASCFCRNTSRL